MNDNLGYIRRMAAGLNNAPAPPGNPASIVVNADCGVLRLAQSIVEQGREACSPIPYSVKHQRVSTIGVGVADETETQRSRD